MPSLHIAIRKILRLLPGGAIIGSNDPDEKLELFESWSGWATLVILLGIVLEIFVLWDVYPPLWSERVWSTIADGLIGFGLIVEYAVIRLTIVASGESKAKADLRVAEAEQETARLRAKVDPRRLNIEVLLKAIEGLPKPTTEVRVLHLKNDNEASSLAWQIAFALGEGKGPDWPIRIMYIDDVMEAGGNAAGGITVAENVPNLEVSTVGRALVNGLTAAVGHVSFSVSNFGPPGTIRIIVAEKPL